MNNKLHSLLIYRGFIIGSVKREFQSKYRNSVLGAAWNIINPLSMIIVYTLIFTEVMQAKLPDIDSTYGYSIYLCSGILTWSLFSEIVIRAQSMFIDNANLLKKISFPKLCLPIILVTNAVLNFAIIFTLFTVFLIVIGNFPGLVILALIPLYLILIIFATGIGIISAVLNVFFRDVGQFVGIFITFWFWLTPIVYPLSILPESLQSVLRFNPMTNLMSDVQNILLSGLLPEWNNLIYIISLSFIFCVLGVRLIRKQSNEIMDEL